jgi:hypothetical protein
MERWDWMKISKIEVVSGWNRALDAALVTSGRTPKGKEPSLAWRKRMLLAEHSPIRAVQFQWEYEDLPSFVSVHLVRHKIGIEHFVRSQRSDRSLRGTARHDLPQDALVSHRCIANAQAIISISRKRLCDKASWETRAAWHALVVALDDIDHEVASCCVPECVYRGFCPEMGSCGLVNLDSWQTHREKYISVLTSP